MATLNVQKVSLTGITPVYVAAGASGDEFANSGRVFLHVKNGGTSPINVTINSQTPCSYGFDHDVVVAVPNGEDKMIGPFPKARFDDPNGKVQVTYSSVASVTVAAIELP